MARNKKRKKSFIRSFFKTILLLVILICLIAGALIYFDPLGIRSIPKESLDTSNESLDISNQVVFDDKVVNIALVGLDRLEENSQRSDTIVILSYDTQTGRTMLTSIMRDLLVYIPDKDAYDKINASYSYGGQELLLKTINKNFDLNIKYFITVDFSAMEKLVNAVGGIDINVKPEEVSYVNDGIREQYKAVGGEHKYLKKSGLQLLDGRQALAYSRIRNVGNADWDRTARQRTVISAIINKVKNKMDIKMLMSLTKNVAPMTKTNIDTKTMLTLFASYLKHKDTFILENFRLPYDNYSLDEYYQGIYYLKPNTLKDNVITLHEDIYGIDSYEPSNDVTDISNDIEYYH